MSKKPKKRIPKSGSRKTAKPSMVSDLSMDSYHETESALLDKIYNLESELSNLKASNEILKDREYEANQFIKERDNIKSQHKEIISGLNKDIDEGLEREIALEKKLEETKSAKETAEQKLSLVRPHRRIRNGIIAVLTLSFLGTSYFFYKDNSTKKQTIRAKDKVIETNATQMAAQEIQISELIEKSKPSEEFIAKIEEQDARIKELEAEKNVLDSELKAITRQRDRANLERANAQSQMITAQRRESELRKAKNGDVPDAIYTFEELRLTFLNYIEKGLGEKYSLSPVYIGCLRGNIIDELDKAREGYSYTWQRLSRETKEDIERCQSDLNVSYDKKEAVTAYILREYMYKDGNFLQTVKQNYRGKLSKR